jgi:tetratricopeptide (TPR) repeat protein
MDFDSDQLQQLLQTGIEAIKRGDRARGREALLSVVEHDDQNETAWLWLSEVMDDPEDVRVALENVLAINPFNADARDRLAYLYEQPTETPVVSSAAATPPSDLERWSKLMPQAPVEPDDGIDDPMQCVYCGRPTEEHHRRCPHCGKNLYVLLERSSDSEALKLGQLLLGCYIALVAFQLVTPLLAYSATHALRPVNYRLIFQIPGFAYFFGDFRDLGRDLSLYLAVGLGARTLLFVIALIGLSQRFRWAYYLSLLALLLDLGLNVYLVAINAAGSVAGVAATVLALVILSLLGAAYREFAVSQVRLLTVPDPQARTAADFHLRGRMYAREKMWGLAMAQWRKAVGLAPRETQYYKDLGIAYAQIRRFERSLRVLEEAQRRLPNDQEIAEIIKLVRKQARR